MPPLLAESRKRELASSEHEAPSEFSEWKLRPVCGEKSENGTVSIDAVRWAFSQQIKPATVKFVLVALADRAGEDHSAFPSIKRLSFDTGLDRKTVNLALRRLVEMGLIEPTGDKRGSTGSIPVYRLIGVPDRSDPNIGTTTENGTAKQARNSPEAGPKFPRSSTDFPRKQAQKRDTEPTKEPSREPTKEPNRKTGSPKTTPLDQLPGWVDKDAWTEFRMHRKEIRKPLTPLAEQKALTKLQGFVEEGYEQREVIDHAIGNGWTGLFPPDKRGHGGSRRNSDQTDRIMGDPLA